jgi:glycosyltransferase involved in cell wall biosynthesis
MTTEGAGATLPCPVLLPIQRFGGHETMLFEWLREAAGVAPAGAPRSDGLPQLQPLVICGRNPALLELCRSAGFPARIVDYAPPTTPGGIGQRLRDFLTTMRALRQLPRDQPVLLAPGLVQSMPQHLLAAILLRRRIACYVAMCQSARQMGLPWPRLRDGLVALLTPHVALWITITPRQATLLREIWRVAAPVVVVPNRIALLRRPFTAPVAREAAREARLRARYIGRFDAHQKGLDWLVGVLRAQRGRLGWLRLTFQGQGPFEAELRRLAGELGAEAVRVEPWGDVMRGLQETDVVVFASRYEGFPLAAVEATHAGVALVASAQSGLADLLPPTSLFEFGDAEGLLQALERLREAGARAAAAAAADERMRRLLSEDAYREGVQAAVRALAALAGAAA